MKMKDLENRLEAQETAKEYHALTSSGGSSDLGPVIKEINEF